MAVRAHGRVTQPAINASAVSLKKSSSVSKTLSDMLASNVRYLELCRAKKEEPCIRRTQYYDGGVYKNNAQGDGNDNRTSHVADGPQQVIDLKSVEGIVEFVQCVSPGHATRQKGITWLNGKMQLVEESATPRNVAETVGVKITEETQGRSQSRGHRRCPSSSASSKRSDSNGRSSSKGSSSADSSSRAACQPSTPQATPSMHSLLAVSTSVSAAQAEQQQKLPPSLKRPNSAGALSVATSSGPAPPTPSLSQPSRLPLSGSVGIKAARQQSTAALTQCVRKARDSILASAVSPRPPLPEGDGETSRPSSAGGRSVKSSSTAAAPKGKSKPRRSAMSYWTDDALDALEAPTRKQNHR